MSAWRWLTVAVILLTPFAVLAYDLVAYLRDGNAVTISRTLLDATNDYPLVMVCVVFLFGVLCGHLFVPQHVQGPTP